MKKHNIKNFYHIVCFSSFSCACTCALSVSTFGTFLPSKRDLPSCEAQGRVCIFGPLSWPTTESFSTFWYNHSRRRANGHFSNYTEKTVSAIFQHNPSFLHWCLTRIKVWFCRHPGRHDFFKGPNAVPNATLSSCEFLLKRIENEED